MPKLKTRRSVAKRFRLTKGGKIKRSKAFKGHLRGCKTSKRRMQIARPGLVSSEDARTIKRLLPYG